MTDEDNNLRSIPPQPPDIREMAMNIAGRIQQVACALLATREYNGPNRHKLIQDSWELIQAIDGASLDVIRSMVAEQQKAREEGPKIITP